MKFSNNKINNNMKFKNLFIIALLAVAGSLQAQTPKKQITNYHPYRENISTDSIQAINETCYISILPETREFEDETSEEADAYFTAMDDLMYYFYVTGEQFEKIGIKEVVASKKYLLFTLNSSEKIVVNTREEQNSGQHALLYKKGEIPVWVDITDSEMEGVKEYLQPEAAGSLQAQTPKKQAKNAENITCTERQADGGYTQIKECTYRGMTVQQVYDIVKKADEHLKPELPAKDIQYKDDENEVEVFYYWRLDKIWATNLYIVLLYNGGETEIEIIEYDDKITSKITYSAD
jgi:ribosomal protein S30